MLMRPKSQLSRQLMKLPVLPAELSGKKSMDVSWKLTGSKFSCESHLSAGCCRSKKGKKQKEKHRGIKRDGPSYPAVSLRMTLLAKLTI